MNLLLFLLAIAVAPASSDRGVMLNAETAAMPREVSIGLPTGEDGAYISEDGLPLCWGIAKPYYQWAGGNAYSQQPLMNLMESVIMTGDIGFEIDSRTKFGTDIFSGIVTGGTSSEGLIKVDASMGGPIKNNWFYSAAVYVNFDPTSVNAPGRTFVNDKQIVKMSLSKRWAGATLNIMYKFSRCNDNIGGYGYAPYIYNGDGSINTLSGFRLGRDCYMPGDDGITWIDVRDGKEHSGDIGRMDERRFHNVKVQGIFHTQGDWNLEATMSFMTTPVMDYTKLVCAGIDNVDASRGFTYRDGRPYAGYVQNRIVNVINSSTTDVYAYFVAKKKVAAHRLQFGAQAMFSSQMEATSTSAIAHQATANPERLNYKGAGEWNYNTNSLYVDAIRSAIVLYGLDSWTPGDRFKMNYGLRMRLMPYSANCANNPSPEDTFNTRVPGFYIGNGTSKLLNYSRVPLDGTATLGASYRIVGRMFALAEGFYSLTSKGPTSFKSAVLPELSPIGNAIARGGVSYDNSWVELTGMFSYATFWNNYKNVSVTKEINGMSETQTYTAQYGVGTIGFTLDGILKFGGFNMHALFTFQDPKYKDYDCHFVFSDGSVQEISYNGKYVSGVSRFLLELDPSYTMKDWRFWLSVRYFSRQYASRTNLAYFNGHWETFGGIDWKITDPLKLSLSFINILGQSGAYGSVDVADTIDDESKLVGYVMAGSYIRPFAANLSVTYTF